MNCAEKLLEPTILFNLYTNPFSNSKIQNIVSRYKRDIFPYRHPPCFTHKSQRLAANS